MGGLRRSGKSSIQKVVFHKMSPNETLFLETTNKIVKNDISNSSFVQFQIWDFPGQLDFFDPAFDSEAIFGGCGALIFVIDAQDEYDEALRKLHMTVTKAIKVNPRISFEVFIHKVDGLSDDHKIEAQRDIQQQALDDLADAKLDVHLSFYLTSIYDHSIFEAFSKVIQKLIPQLPIGEVVPYRRGEQDLRGDGQLAGGHADVRAVLGHDRRRDRRLVHLRHEGGLGWPCLRRQVPVPHQAQQRHGPLPPRSQQVSCPCVPPAEGELR